MNNYFDYYASINDLSPQGRRSHWRYLEKTLGPWLPRPASDPLSVDTGCCAGILMEWLTSQDYRRVRGVDRDAGQVAFARGIVLDVSLANDATAWLTQQTTVNLVVMKDVLEHIPDGVSQQLLRSVAAQLASDGRIYLAAPNASASFATRWRYIDATHLRSYTEHSLRWQLAAAGLKVLHVTSDDAWVAGLLAGRLQQALKRSFRLWRRLEAMAEFRPEGLRLPLGLNLIVIAARDD